MIDVAKYSIGRLRPNFRSVCKPIVDCTTNNTNKYHLDYECEEKDEFLLKESRLSFYSGHAAFSFYIAWYISVNFFLLFKMHFFIGF